MQKFKVNNATLLVLANFLVSQISNGHDSQSIQRGDLDHYPQNTTPDTGFSYPGITHYIAFQWVPLFLAYATTWEVLTEDQYWDTVVQFLDGPFSYPQWEDLVRVGIVVPV